MRVERATERPRQSGLADAGIVLDEDVTLGHQGDDQVVEDRVAHLDRPPDVLVRAGAPPKRRRDLGAGTPPRACLKGLMAPFSRHLPVEDERRLKTSSRIARRPRPWRRARRGARRPAVTIVTSLSVASKPMSGAPMSLTTIASRPLRAASRARRRARRRRARRRSRRASGRGGGGREPDSTSGVRSSASASGRAGRVLLELAGVRGRRAEVGDGGRHHQHVAGGEALARTRPPARSRSQRRRLDAGAARQRTFAATTVTSAPRRAASSASAKPIRPEERLPT